MSSRLPGSESVALVVPDEGEVHSLSTAAGPVLTVPEEESLAASAAASPVPSHAREPGSPRTRNGSQNLLY